MRSPALLLFALSLVLLVSIGCDSGSGGGGGGARGDVCVVSGYRCATPGCASYPTTIGCVDVPPQNGACPVELPRCFSPTDDAHRRWYCDPKIAICAKPKDPYPMDCPQLAAPCARADVIKCYDTNSDIFCRGDFNCTLATCFDMAMPQDMSAPQDASTRD